MTVTSSTGTFTLTNAKTLTVSNTMTFTATDGSTLAIGTGGTLGAVAYTALSSNFAWTGVHTFNKTIPNIGTGTGGSVTPTSDSTPQFNISATSAVTVNAPSGSPSDGQRLMLRFLDNGTARNITWNGIFVGIGLTLPSTTVISKYLYVGCVYNANSSKWDVVATGQQ